MKTYEMITGAMSIMEWVELLEIKFINRKSVAILRSLSEEEQGEFDCDINNINWKEYIKNYIRGMQIYALNQDQVQVEHNLTQIIMKNKRLFDDVNEVLKPKKAKDLGFIDTSKINDIDRFTTFIKCILNERDEKSGY
jgi:hypothetical protein